MSTQQASPSSHTPEINECGMKEITMTPTPWKVQSGTFENGCKKIVAVDKNRNMYIMVHGGSTETLTANASHIVRCVNTHDQLVAALKDMHEVLSDLLEDPHAQMTTQRYAALQAIDKSNQALAAAEKGA